MQGDPEVLEILNDVLSAELTGVNQYFAHAKMQTNWGYAKLAQTTRTQSIEEMKHAESIIERILYFEGRPDVSRLGPISLGGTVEEQLRLDLVVEHDAVERLNNGIRVCTDKGDNGSRDLLEQILVSEEEHVDWLETQINLIGDLGAQTYLADQM